MLGITTLEEYFSWIRNLGNINRKYTILPIDEDHFEINANTRAINIPANFKKNGIAVQGDDLAEVVYFKIDRYFDYMDFNNCDIFIQWETPKDANGVIHKSVSPAYIRDIESEPGKLIFGWAISDAITGQSGNLKFSVRFFQWEDDDKADSGEGVLAYSFNTLTANVAIQSSLNFDLEKEYDPAKLDDVGDRLIGRLENSEIAGGYAAALPVFIKDLDVPNADLIYDLVCINPEAAEEDRIYEYDLLVHAFSEDTGAISYTWKKQGLNEDNEPAGEEIASVVVENYMHEITDLANMEEEDYPYSIYKLNGTDQNGKPVYTLYRGTIPPSVEDIKNGLKLFEKHSIFTATEAGLYWAIAENRITNSSASQESKKAMFPRPQWIVITEQPVEQARLLDIDNDDPDLGAIATLNVKVQDQDSTVEVKSYKWYRDENHAMHFADKEASWTPVEENGTSATLVTNLPGHYKVEVTNTRNNAKKSLFSTIARVTLPAQPPQLLVLDSDKKDYQISSLSSENCPTIRMDADVESDWYDVEWYLNEGAGKLIHTESLDPGELRASFNPKAFEDKILEVTTEGNNIEGSYYAIVINNVNGSQARTIKPLYDNMFKVTH